MLFPNCTTANSIDIRNGFDMTGTTLFLGFGFNMQVTKVGRKVVKDHNRLKLMAS